jgi:hypothetical protein
MAKAKAPDGTPPAEDPPVDIASELAKLDPAQAALFVQALELTMRKRRWMLLGYLAAMFAVLIGQVLALLVWANRTPGTFVGWVFLVPLALAGGILVATSSVVRRLKPRP